MTAMPARDDRAPAISLAASVAARVAAGARFAGLFGTAVPGGTGLEGTGTSALLLSAHLAAGGDLHTVEALVPAAATGYPAVTPLVDAAFWYEREVHDLFGIVPEGHPAWSR